MARLYFFAEGQTEQTFAHIVLSPHLAQRGVYLHKPILIAHARKKRVVHRGGGRNYDPMKSDIERFLAQESAPDVFFTTMIDLYAIPEKFPGLAEAEKLRHVPFDRVAAIEQAFADDLKDYRFIPYIQLHEFEAYLFAEPRRFESFYPDQTTRIEALEKISNAVESPELINDGPTTAPSKRIIEQLPGYGKDKAVEGPQVAALIGIATIRKKCPHFDRWLAKLEVLADAQQAI